MANEQHNSSDDRTSSSKKSPPKLLFIIPVVLLAGILWMLMRKPEPPVTPVPVAPVPSTPPGHRKPPPTANDPVAAKLLPSTLTIFVPNDNAKLERQKISNPVKQSNGDPVQDYVNMADAALKALQKKTPDLFPAGCFVGPVRRDGDLVSVNLSKSWYEMPQWSQGSSNALLAQNSLVNTLASLDTQHSATIKVQLLQDGKLATSFGELDIKDPLEPNMDSVAKG